MANADNSSPAFPVYDHHGNGQQFLAATGMTLRQYAAIKLKVPNSGTDWLDEMIIEAKRDDFAEKAMPLAFQYWRECTNGAGVDGEFVFARAEDEGEMGLISTDCYEMADSMIQARNNHE